MTLSTFLCLQRWTRFYSEPESRCGGNWVGTPTYHVTDTSSVTSWCWWPFQCKNVNKFHQQGTLKKTFSWRNQCECRNFHLRHYKHKIQENPLSFKYQSFHSWSVWHYWLADLNYSSTQWDTISHMITNTSFYNGQNNRVCKWRQKKQAISNAVLILLRFENHLYPSPINHWSELK